MDRANNPASLPQAWRPFLTGRCFDFALALHKLLPDSRLVAFGSSRWPDHVAVQIGHGKQAQLIDVRGPLPIEKMLAGMNGADRALQAGPIPVSVDEVALHVGHTAKSLRLGADVRALAAQRLREFRNQLFPLGQSQDQHAAPGPDGSSGQDAAVRRRENTRHP